MTRTSRYLLAVVVLYTLLIPFALRAADEGILPGTDQPGVSQYCGSTPCATPSGFIPLASFGNSAKIGNLYATQDLEGFINKLFVGAIAIGGIIAVLRLAWAGWLYIGSDLWSNKEKAKETIRETLIGLFLLLAIYVILNQINPNILKLNVIQTMERSQYIQGVPCGPKGCVQN